MNTKVLTKLVFTVIFAFSSPLWASKRSRAIRYGTMVGQQTGDSISKESQANTGVDQTEYDSIKQSSTDNVNNSQKGQTVAYLMAGGLAIAAARNYGMCTGQNYAACVAGAILTAMALSADKSGKSFDVPIADSWNNVCQYSSNGCGAVPNPYTAAVDLNRKNDALIAAEKMNKSKGVSVDASSGIVKLPSGKEVNLNDPASMSAVMGSQNASKVLSEVKKIEQDAINKVEQIQPGSLSAAYGMGATGGNPAGPGYDSESDSSVKAELGQGLLARKPAQVNGLTKNFNGDPIGVSGDSIFGMMSRRYKLKSNQKSFFGPEL